MTPEAMSQTVKRLARELGLDAIGIARPGPSPRAEYYRRWLAGGNHGEMTYLKRNQRIRADASKLMPDARSVICAAAGYYRPDEADAKGVGGRIARYARGADYHRVLRVRLTELLDHLRDEIAQPFDARVCVDTAPVNERELAAAAGLGWIGKNTLVLNRRLGSYFVLGEVFTTLDLAPDSPQTDHCGTCTRCLDACPTGAFPAPYEMDASRCISYLTIEFRGEIPAELQADMRGWVYGCDICQEVCPYNRDAPVGSIDELVDGRTPARIPLPTLARLRTGEHRRMTRGTAINRANRNMLRRNALAAMGAAADLDEDSRACLAEALADPHAPIRRAAEAALPAV